MNMNSFGDRISALIKLMKLRRTNGPCHEEQDICMHC